MRAAFFLRLINLPKRRFSLIPRSRLANLTRILLTLIINREKSICAQLEREHSRCIFPATPTKFVNDNPALCFKVQSNGIVLKAAADPDRLRYHFVQRHEKTIIRNETRDSLVEMAGPYHFTAKVLGQRNCSFLAIHLSTKRHLSFSLDLRLGLLKSNVIGKTLRASFAEYGTTRRSFDERLVGTAARCIRYVRV